MMVTKTLMTAVMAMTIINEEQTDGLQFTALCTGLGFSLLRRNGIETNEKVSEGEKS